MFESTKFSEFASSKFTVKPAASGVSLFTKFYFTIFVHTNVFNMYFSARLTKLAETCCGGRHLAGDTDKHWVGTEGIVGDGRH